MKNKKLKHAILIAGTLATMLFTLFAPSLDRQEEMHGYLRSGRFVIGNGIMVGIATNRIAFLTCRHVVTEKMLETRRSFIDKATDDNAICINRKGYGFVYETISNIDPARWHFADDNGQDFAWIVLTDDELHKIAPDGCPPFIQLPQDLYSEAPELITEWHFENNGIGIGTPVSAIRFFSPVLGEGSAEKLHYYNVFLKIPFFEKSIGIATRKETTLQSRRMQLRVTSNDPINHLDQIMPSFIIDLPSHVNNSGSPVFAISDDGSKSLIGIINASKGNASAFQTLDRVIKPIRQSLETVQR